MQVTESAAAYRKARSRYEQAFQDYFANGISVLPDDRFWELQAVFVHEVRVHRFGYSRTNGIEQACDELFRKSLAEDFRDGCRYSLDEAIRFAKTWQSWRERLYLPLFDVVRNRSDDAYVDLLDALPLAGREVIEEALAEEFADEQQFEAAVFIGCDGDQQLTKLILHGENYIGMLLTEAAKEGFASGVAREDA